MLSIGDPLQHDLGAEECMRLLGATSLGRLWYTQSALPAVQPVTYRLVDGAVFIPAVAGSRSTGAIRDGIVVLAIDSFGCDSSGDDQGTDQGTGWAVSVIGPARLVDTSAADPERSPGRPPGCFLVLDPALVTGWRRAPAGSLR